MTVKDDTAHTNTVSFTGIALRRTLNGNQSIMRAGMRMINIGWVMVVITMVAEMGLQHTVMLTYKTRPVCLKRTA